MAATRRRVRKASVRIFSRRRTNRGHTPPRLLNAHTAAVDAILSQPQPNPLRDGEITRILPHRLLGDADHCP